MRTKGWSLFFSFALVAALISSLTACGDKGGSRRGGVEQSASAMPVVEPPVRTLPPLPVRPLSPKLEAERGHAAAAASALRGLPWLGDAVGMTELSGWEYGTRTRELAEVLGADDLKALSGLAVAGGILPEGTDLAALAATFTAVAADATYSPLDKQVILVTGDTKNKDKDAARRHSLFTHEFVHALQDQHFDLLRMLLARPYNFDRTEAAFAVVEGDAVNVQRRLEVGDAAFARNKLENIWRQEDARFDATRRQVGAFFPPLLTETFIFRYRDGSRFVEAVRRARPAAGSDELFRRPPASTEQVLHPEKYLANEQPREAALDEATFASEGWRAPVSTPLGEIGMRGLLLAGASQAEAARAAAGWGGDRAYVFEREGSAPLFVWRTIWDSPADAREFFRAYNTLMRRVASSRAGSDAARGGEAQEAIWHDGARLVRVRLEGDTVLVVRGAGEDVAAAARLAGM